MRFLISVIDSTSGSATADEYAAIDAFNSGLQANGNWIAAFGLGDPSTATVIDARTASVLVRPGAHHVTDEWISGCWLIQVDSGDEAKRLAEEASRACNRRVELRPLLG
jgi:hypothetical protein